MRSKTLFIALAASLFIACDDGKKAQGDAGTDAGTDGLAFAGEDIDERATKELASSYDLPQQFFDALDTLGLAPEDLSYPDASSTFANTPTRLHWTDTVRHDAQQGPTFGYMVSEDVRAALMADAPETILRELLVAQYIYQDRDDFTISRYDERIVVDDAEKPLLAALRAYYEHEPVEGAPWSPPVSWSELEPGLDAGFAGWPIEIQNALALAIEGLVRAAELRNAALLSGDYPVGDWDLLHERFLN
jgi:hypothetical protein